VRRLDAALAAGAAVGCARVSTLNEIEVPDQSVRGQVDQEIAFGSVCHQAVAQDATHLALVPSEAESAAAAGWCDRAECWARTGGESDAK
jgi:hypothetical protein